jgi:outer membrane protein TolC
VVFIALISRRFFALGLLALLYCSASFAQEPNSLTLDDALRIAEERSQELVADDATATAAREMAAAADQAPDPMLKAGINNLPINGADAYSLTNDFMTMRSIGLSRELTRHDKRDARAARYEREAEAAEAARTVALSDLQRDTAMAWLERYYRESVREVLVRQRDQAALQIEAADLAYRSGRGSQSDLFAARASVAEIDDRLAEAARDSEIAITKLARWIGTEAHRPLAQPPLMANARLTDSDLDSQLAHHPEIALMLKQEEVARADVDIARAAKRSDWTIEVTYSQRGPDFSNLMSFNVSKPLQWRESQRQDREVAARLATAEKMRAEREEETRSHVADAKALLQAWQANRQRLERYASGLMPLASERTAAMTTAYRGGTGTLGAVLDARIAETDARIRYLELELETANLWAELNYLVPAASRAAHEHE